MSLTDYRNRVLLNGSTYQEKVISDIKKSFKEYLNSTPNTYTITYNDVNYQVVIQDITSNAYEISQGKKILQDKYLLTDTDFQVKIGFYITFNNKKWIIINYPELVHNAYWCARMRMCNNVLTLQTGVTKTQIGTDSLGRPIFDETKQYTSWDCIVSQKLLNMSDTDKPFLLPENRISIVMPYVDNPAINENAEFNMFGDTYKIIGIDRTNIMDTDGILILLCQRVV